MAPKDKRTGRPKTKVTKKREITIEQSFQAGGESSQPAAPSHEPVTQTSDYAHISKEDLAAGLQGVIQSVQALTDYLVEYRRQRNVLPTVTVS